MRIEELIELNHSTPNPDFYLCATSFRLCLRVYLVMEKHALW